MTNKEIQGIVIHHSLSHDGQTRNWNAIKKWQMTHMLPPLGDIGYHYGIEDIHGGVEIVTGRPLQVQGAHTRGFNNTIGICLVGNYDEHRPSQDKLTKLMDLVLGLLITFNLKPEQVHPHSSFSHKSCPGKMFPWEEFHSVLSFKHGKLKDALKEKL